jgi:hypothetical protein
LWIASLMQDGYDKDAILAELIEESVRETLEKNAPEGAMYEMKGQRVPLRQCNCVVNGFEEILAELT